MINSLIFATHNQHKKQEVQKMFTSSIELLSLNDVGFFNEIVEDGSTFRENAKIKSKTVFEFANKNVFSDDSGLVVNALGGDPGIRSARYSKTGDSFDNCQLLLKNLHEKKDRTAYFYSVICLMKSKDEVYFFEGRVDGEITTEFIGKDGFGYDPLFIPNGYNKTFAEMKAVEKNSISHRALAIGKLIKFLEN